MSEMVSSAHLRRATEAADRAASEIARMVPDVSRRTFPAAPAAKRRPYRCPVKSAMSRVSREAVFQAALVLIRMGRVRPGREELGRAAGYRGSVVSYHFATMELFYRCLARERWRDVAVAVGLKGMPDHEQRRLVWLIVAGCPEPDLMMKLP